MNANKMPFSAPPFDMDWVLYVVRSVSHVAVLYHLYRSLRENWKRPKPGAATV